MADGKVGWVLWNIRLNDSKKLRNVPYKCALPIINVSFKCISWAFAISWERTFCSGPGEETSPLPQRALLGWKLIAILPRLLINHWFCFFPSGGGRRQHLLSVVENNTGHFLPGTALALLEPPAHTDSMLFQWRRCWKIRSLLSFWSLI